MRIVITSAHSIEGETGSALIAEVLAKQLAKNDDILYMKLGRKFRSKKITKHLTILSIPTSDINGIVVPVITPDIVKKIYSKLDEFAPEIIHAQNIIFGSLLALIWAKERKIPYVLTLHAPPHQGMVYIYPRLSKNYIASNFDRMLTLTYNKTILENVDTVVALNNIIVQSLKKLSLSTKSVLINNGINLTQLKALKTGKPKDGVRFIFPGSYMDRKNQTYLARVFQYLPDNYVLNLYGIKKTGGIYLKKLERMVEKNEISNVKINDYVEGPNLLKAYDESNYLLSASTKEVQSLVFIEALAAGKPIIALQNETTDDILKNDNNSLILPQKTLPKIFAKKMMVFVKNTNEHYEATSSACRQTVNRFDIKSVSDKHMILYQKVINESKVKTNTMFLLKIFLVCTEIASLAGIMIESFLKSKRSIFQLLK